MPRSRPAMYRAADVPKPWCYSGDDADPPVVAFPVGVPIPHETRKCVLRYIRWITQQENLPKWRIPLEGGRLERWREFGRIMERRKRYILIYTLEEARLVWKCCHYDNESPNGEREPVRPPTYYRGWRNVRRVLHWLGHAQRGHPLEVLGALDQEPSSAICSKGCRSSHSRSR